MSMYLHMFMHREDYRAKTPEQIQYLLDLPKGIIAYEEFVKGKVFKTSDDYSCRERLVSDMFYFSNKFNTLRTYFREAYKTSFTRSHINMLLEYRNPKIKEISQGNLIKLLNMLFFKSIENGNLHYYVTEYRLMIVFQDVCNIFNVGSLIPTVSLLLLLLRLHYEEDILDLNAFDPTEWVEAMLNNYDETELSATDMILSAAGLNEYIHNNYIYAESPGETTDGIASSTRETIRYYPDLFLKFLTKYKETISKTIPQFLLVNMFEMLEITPNKNLVFMRNKINQLITKEIYK